jgi:hypothetical protein
MRDVEIKIKIPIILVQLKKGAHFFFFRVWSESGAILYGTGSDGMGK